MIVDANKLDELADCVERLTGPCDYMDAEIWCALNGLGDVSENRPGMRPEGTNYTASLDAAMTLVPGRWRTECVTQDIYGLEWQWHLYSAFTSQSGVNARSGTAPLALTAACLRALAKGN